MHSNGPKESAKVSGSARLSSDAIAALDGGPPDAELSIVARVRRAMVDHDLNQKAIAAQSGVGIAVFNQWFQEKYKGDSAKVDAKMSKWLRGLGERVSMTQLLPAEPEYFTSETSARIVSHLKAAHALQDMLAVFGVPGVGKTKSARWYQGAFSNVWIVTFSPAITGTIPVLQEIAEAVGAERPKQGQGARRVLASLDKVFKDSKGLLIVDEAHHLSINALDTLRHLHDRMGIAIALIGGVELQTKILAMPQLHRRIGLRLFATAVLQADIDAQLEAWNITKREQRKIITDVAKRHGALGAASKVIRLASMSAAASGEELSVQHLKDAAETLSQQATGEDV